MKKPSREQERQQKAAGDEEMTLINGFVLQKPFHLHFYDFPSFAARK